MRMLRMTCFIGLAACAQAQMPAPAQPPLEGSVVPGTIGVAVERSGDAVVVDAVGRAAERAGVRVGDRIARYNGEPISGVRQFERLVLESVPGRVAHIEVWRDGTMHSVDVPIEQIRTADRA